MPSGVWLEAVIIVVLILANGFFAASEIAVVSSRKGRLEQRVESGDRGAKVALGLAENPNRFLSTVQVGITVISTLAAAFGGASLARGLESTLRTIEEIEPYASTIALGLVVLAISYLSLIIGELVPKRLALQSAEQMASRVAPVMRGLAWTAAPVVGFLTFSTEVVLRLLGRHGVAETPVTEDDVLALVREGTAEGTLEEAEQDLINSVFTFTDRTVRSLMTPRTQVVAVEVDTPLDEVLKIITESGYSRIPVYKETLDRVVGILYVKDLLRGWDQPNQIKLQNLLRPPLYLLEGQRAVAAFQQLKLRRSALAMVLDEYGQIAGLISIEDMLEELVGDLADEYDEAEESFVRREDGSFLVDGLMPFPDVQARLQLPNVDELTRERDFETFAGFLLSLLGRIPVVGETAAYQGYVFEVIDMDQRRIDKILVRPPVVTPGDQTEGVLARGAMLPLADRSSQSKAER